MSKHLQILLRHNVVKSGFQLIFIVQRDIAQVAKSIILLKNKIRNKVVPKFKFGALNFVLLFPLSANIDLIC